MVSYISRHEIDARIALVIDGKRINTNEFSMDMFIQWPQFTDDPIFKPRRRQLNTAIKWLDENGRHEVKARLVIYRICPISGLNILIYSTQEG